MAARLIVIAIVLASVMKYMSFASIFMSIPETTLYRLPLNTYIRATNVSSRKTNSLQIFQTDISL